MDTRYFLVRDTRFQSTPPCGGDLNIVCSAQRPEPHFNPRPLAGATIRHSIGGGGAPISIHAPLRGRPAGWQEPYPHAQYFNPRPLAGATLPLGGVKWWNFGNFNPRPLAGATGGIKMIRMNHVISIHAPLRGRPNVYEHSTRVTLISIHAPLRGRPM